MKSYAPPSVLINEKGDIQYVHEERQIPERRQVKPSSISSTWHGGLRGELSRAIRKAIDEKQP